MGGVICEALRSSATIAFWMDGLAEFGKGMRRSNNDQGVDAVRSHEPLQHACHVSGEMLSLKLVPVRLADSTSSRVCKGPPIDATRAVAPCSWVDGLGFSSTTTCSTNNLGRTSPPVLRRNRALRPSPTNTMASVGIRSSLISICLLGECVFT